jgi:hypothetical protein
MGIMQFDERGVWIDDYYQRQFGSPSVTVNVDSDTEGESLPDVAPNSQPSILPLEVPAKP